MFQFSACFAGSAFPFGILSSSIFTLGDAGGLFHFFDGVADRPFVFERLA